MVVRRYDNIVAQQGRKRKDGSRSRTYYYRVRQKGAKPLWVRMAGVPGDVEFEAQYRKLVQPEDLRGSPFSFRVLIGSYRDSSRYRQLSDRSKKDYSDVMDLIGEWLGEMDASRYPRPEVIRMRDENARRPRRANYCVQVMSILMEHAIDLGWRNDNPAKSVKKLKGQGGYRPWRVNEIEAYRAAADQLGLLIFELHMGTGQRPGDVTAMRWSDYDGHEICVIQSKTGAELWIPPTDRLRQVLDEAKMEANGSTILANQRGEPLTYHQMARSFRKSRTAAGIDGVSFHGLRKNATITLAEAGCSNAEIKAITGHTTDAMVELYSKGARQKTMARNARRRTSGDAHQTGPISKSGQAIETKVKKVEATTGIEPVYTDLQSAA